MLNMRAPGMKLTDVPMFVWNMLVTSTYEFIAWSTAGIAILGFSFAQIPTVKGRNPLWAAEEEGRRHTNGARPHAGSAK